MPNPPICMNMNILYNYIVTNAPQLNIKILTLKLENLKYLQQKVKNAHSAQCTH